MTTHLINGLAVEIDGEGEALLCIHGLGGSSNTWTPVLAALSGFKVIRPDLPGSARSPLLEQPLSIERYAGALEDLLATLGVESLHIMAHSLGTIVAQHFAVRNPGRVKSLAMFGPVGRAAGSGKTAASRRAPPLHAAVRQPCRRSPTPSSRARPARKRRSSSPQFLRLCARASCASRPRAMRRAVKRWPAAQSAEIERIDVPTLLVTGDQDGVAPPANVEAMASRIAESRQVVFDGCGHWTTFEKPQRCMQELEQFHASLALIS